MHRTLDANLTRTLGALGENVFMGGGQKYQFSGLLQMAWSLSVNPKSEQELRRSSVVQRVLSIHKGLG